MTGLAAVPDRTLVDRALEYLAAGPRSAAELARDVLGLPAANAVIADRLAAALLGADPRVRKLDDGRWAAVAAASASPPLEEVAFAVLDVETTGTRPSDGDRVTDVAVVLVQGTRCELVYESLVNPGMHIPPWITAMTGISDALVADAPPFERIADDLLQVLAGRVFTAHNARFDWGFIDAEVKRTRGLALVGTRMCTVRLARALLPELPSRGLDALQAHFGIPNQARHRARGDALATAELLGRLLEMASERNCRTLADVEAMIALGKKR
ncbi:MAG TPA: 3'-5' exonuclease [Gemmatimonadales bacterium]|nr:3'-5' exonuclease [Gemmatimonadales bacterium]